MCTGRVDPSFIFRALKGGADGVIIGGCWPGECHYVTEGNYDALANVLLCRKLFEKIGVAPERLRLEWIATSEGARFAAVMTDFYRRIKALGPLGRTEGLDGEVLKDRIEAVQRLVPYLKLVEREKLRPPVRSEQGYKDYYEQGDGDRLFDALVTEKLVLAQILLFLGRGPLSPAELAGRTGLSSSALARHLERAAMEGLVTYDPDRGKYVPASAWTAGAPGGS